MPDPEKSTLIYRRRAAELEELAARASLRDSRDRYLRLAEEWRKLADSSDVMTKRWGGQGGAGPVGEPETSGKG